MTKQPDKQSADTDDTMQARPSDEPETVVVDSHTISVDRAALAWTLEDEAADKPQRRSWPRTVGLATGIAACCTALAAGLWFATPGLRPPSSNRPVPPTVSAAPTSEPPIPSMLPSVPDATPQDRDMRFLALMQRNMPPQYDVKMVESAHWTCDHLAAGTETKVSIVKQFITGTSITVDQATFFVNTAVDMYCPEFN